MTHDRRARLLVLTLGVLLVSTGASWPLNPLVTRNPQPPAVTPVECEQGLAPAPAPRVIVAELPAPAEIVPAAVPAAPPSRTLRRTLEDAHTALLRNDRPAFDAALANARVILRDYPPGAERTNGEEALRAYDDAAFLWDAQFRSPFFDQNSEAYARASRYPGYAESVRRGVFTDDADRRFYPAAESRTFLARVASERLGIRTQAPPTRVARAERPQRTQSTERATPAPRRTTARRAAPARTSTRTRKSATPAISAPASPDPPAPARAVADTAPAAPPAAAPTPAADPASPAAEGQPVDDVPEPVAAPDTSAAAPAPSLTPPPEAPAPAAAATESKSRSVVVPALLILIGLGVLFVLFRVSK